MYLAKMTTTDACAAFEHDPIVVIPVGSTEVHGTHSALGTDFLAPSWIADQIADMENVIVAPTVPYGVCPTHLSFAGSIDIGYEGLYLVLHGITSSLMSQGIRRFLVINGHGGNNPSIDRASMEVYHKGGVLACIDWWSVVGQLDDRFKGGHGDILETSVMMAICPEAVKLDQCQPLNPQHPTEEVSASYLQTASYRGASIRLYRDSKELGPSGWFGPFDPKDSTAELGQAALDAAADFVRGFIGEFHKFKL